VKPPKKWTVIGLMSGTSTDGIDAVLTTLEQRAAGYHIRSVRFETTRYPSKLRQRLLDTAEGRPLAPEQLGRLNSELGLAFAAAVIRLRQRGVATRVDLIGSHGHTIFHGPPGSGSGAPTTLQIGEPAFIAARTGITTVADFRPADVAVGGQGAPLAPYVHALLFRDSRRNRAIHNLGGISNVTFLPSASQGGKIFAFDTGPANMVIDAVTRIVTRERLQFDRGGKLAARGRVDTELVRRLLRHPFLQRKPPKSTGREEFGASYVEKFLSQAARRRLTPESSIATATAFTAASVAKAYRDFLCPIGAVDEAYFCGGGSRNPTLMAMLKAELGVARVGVTDDVGVNADALEAIAFAVLAIECVRGRVANLPVVTGARHPAILGKIVPGTPESFRRVMSKAR
jgi:anhydro-N-acetylmuramic acid kinase